MEKGIIEKLRDSQLRGRGGAGFETWIKWKIVKESSAKQKYIICNGADGEIESSKDGFILDNYLEDVVNGILIAIREVGAQKAYIFLRKDYFDKYRKGLLVLAANQPIILFEKPEVGYIGGEETTICEIIEGREAKPRLKPPYLAENGLFGCPTLINNIETFYCVSKIAQDDYKGERFYYVSGKVKNKGIFVLPDSASIRDVLQETGNSPDFDYFVQVGGYFGEIFLPDEIDSRFPAISSITVFDKNETDIYCLIEKIAEFFHKGNCDKCTPCREGSFLICEMAKNKSFDYEKVEQIIFSLENSSFCAFGRNMAISLKSIFKKLIKNGKNQVKN